MRLTIYKIISKLRTTDIYPGIGVIVTWSQDKLWTLDLILNNTKI